MKTYSFILLASYWHTVPCEKSFSFAPETVSAVVLNAVSNVINQVFFSKNLVPSLIRVNSNTMEDFLLNDFADELLRENFILTRVSFFQQASYHLMKAGDQPRDCAIFAVNNFDAFLQDYEKYFSSCKFNGFYLIVLVGEVHKAQSIFALLWKLQIYNVNIMFEDPQGSVRVETFMPFNAGKCNDTSSVLINTYRVGKFINGVENFYPDKIRNMHNCSVRVATSNEAEPFVIAERLTNGASKLSGRDIDIMRALSESLNFSLHFTFVGLYGYLFDNGTAAGAFLELKSGKADLIIADYWLKSNRLIYFDATTSYVSEQLVFIISPAEEISDFERLYLPYSLWTWVLIYLYIIVGHIVIFIVYRRSKKVQNFVFGDGVNNPYINLFIAFIGLSQHRLPKRNFARFLLMMFLMYNLVMRTLYAASYYKQIHLNMRHKEPQSIDEMISKDFKFYVAENLLDVFKHSEKIMKR